MRAHNVEVELLTLNTKARYLVAPAKLMAKTQRRSVTLDHFRIVLQDYARQIKRFAKDRAIDVVFSTSTIPVTLLDCGKPIVTWTDAVFHAMHDYYNKAFANMTEAAIARGKWQEETALRNCSIAAFASTWALERARPIVGDAKLKVLPFGSNLPARHTREDVTRWAVEKRAKHGKQCELLFVGANWERKGGSIAVETARLMIESGIKTKLRVVGSQPEGNVPDYVELFGFINKSSEAGIQRLVELFQSADFFILPTKAEAAGVVFSEASSYGLPTLTYATGGVPDYVHNGVNGVCLEPGASPARFAREIQTILSSPSVYESLAVGGFREYQERLNWRTSVGRLLNLCAECARA